MLHDIEWKKWANANIALHCGVSHTYVNRVDKELSLNVSGYIPKPVKRTVERGDSTYEMDTTNLQREAEPQLPVGEPDQELAPTEEVLEKQCAGYRGWYAGACYYAKAEGTF